MCDSKEDERAKALAAEIAEARERKLAQFRWPMTPLDPKGVRHSPADKMIRSRDLLTK